MSNDLMIADDFFDENQLALIMDSFGKNLTKDEFKLFLYVARYTRLDPMLKQIYAVKYGTNPMSIITAIDGYRIVAERTGAYCPGRSPTFTHDKDGKLVSAIAYVKKRTSDGTWHEVEGMALYCEYVQMVKDKNTHEWRPNKTWGERAYGQLAKCAEALALRKAFPNDLSAIRTEDEMGKLIDEGDAIVVKAKQIDKPEEKISPEQVNELVKLLECFDVAFRNNWFGFIKGEPISAHRIEDIPVSRFETLKNQLVNRVKTLPQKEEPPKEFKENLFDVDEIEKDIANGLV